jgi:hypothetical protein
MYSRALNILLAVGIFACPLVCRGRGQCCGNEHTTLEHACCESCGTNPGHHDRDRSDNGESDSDDCCQCICGGAVVEVEHQQLHLDECAWITPSASAIHVVAAIVEPQLDFICTPALPNDDMNPGRAMRCRLMSFLC